MEPPIVILDANVLYPATLRSFLMYLARENVFRPRWTSQIHDEWARNLSANRPDITPEKLARLRNLVDANVDDCLVTGYEHLIDDLTLPDPNDRHVLAAAIHVNAEIIVTSNIRDFPATALDRYGIAAEAPDVFVSRLIGSAPTAVCRAFKSHRMSLKNPPSTVGDLLKLFDRSALAGTAAALRELIEWL